MHRKTKMSKNSIVIHVRLLNDSSHQNYLFYFSGVESVGIFVIIIITVQHATSVTLNRLNEQRLQCYIVIRNQQNENHNF